MKTFGIFCVFDLRRYLLGARGDRAVWNAGHASLFFLDHFAPASRFAQDTLNLPSTK
jgi:hypothetical protein